MRARLARFLRHAVPHPALAYAIVRGWVSRHPLPPGDLAPVDRLEPADRCFLLERYAALGPVFKATGWRRLYVCVVGLPLGRRLLREHGAALQPVTIDPGALFPHGLMRQMTGDTHRRYRKDLVRAIKPGHLAASRPGLEAIAASGLAGYAADQPRNGHAPEAYIAALRAIATGMLVQTFFGADFGSAFFEQLMRGYHQLGPDGCSWDVGPAQRAAFAGIRDRVLAEIAGRPGGLSPRSIAGAMHAEDVLDATALGNLVYMVEMGRFDVYSFFRWLTKHAADRPDLLERIACEEARPPVAVRSLAGAFVQETLRTDQSERLIRIATRDIVFEGHLIPRGTIVRVCLWEAHNSADAFPDALRFDPERFLERDPSGDRFSPFGLDQHHCPLSEVSVELGTIFLRALARSYTVTPIDDGPPVRRRYHWEPASRFSVRLEERRLDRGRGRPRVSPSPCIAPAPSRAVGRRGGRARRPRGA